MHLKIDTKQKIKYIRTYLSQLKTSPQTLPFITINPLECGMYDYEYITRKSKTINDIEKDLKDNKYQYVREVCEDIKVLYYKVQDYLLLEDPLQERIGRLVRAVGQFQVKFGQDFKQNRLSKPQSKPPKKQQPKPQVSLSQDPPQPHPQKQSSQQLPPVLTPLQEYNRKSTFAQKLQMFFYLKSHEDNIEYIKNIGESYNIGKEDIDGNYVIKLENNVGNCLWLELLQKKDM